jgi:hypothetical protein
LISLKTSIYTPSVNIFVIEGIEIGGVFGLKGSEAKATDNAFVSA